MNTRSRILSSMISLALLPAWAACEIMLERMRDRVFMAASPSMSFARCRREPPQPGRLVTFNLKLLGLGVNAAGAIPLGAPVRGYEHVIYQLYQPAGDTSFYVGFQPAGGTMQPLIGPVLTNGLTFQYFNANGVVTAVASQVARVDITVRARTVSAVRRGGMAAAATIVDSITTSVALRNNRRF